MKYITGLDSVTAAAIWDAAGDLAVGTGADRAARLAIGTAGQVLTVAGGTATWAAGTGAAILAQARIQHFSLGAF